MAKHLKDTYLNFVNDINAVQDMYEKYNILLLLREFVTKEIPLTKKLIKESPAPNNISELKVYYIVDELNNKYSVDAATGALTKV